MERVVVRPNNFDADGFGTVVVEAKYESSPSGQFRSRFLPVEIQPCSEKVSQSPEKFHLLTEPPSLFAECFN